MPICTRAGLDKKAQAVDKFQDDEKVFFCELTKEIFRDYEDYFERVMLLNSTIWSCSETGKPNLTYAEALKSERRARKTGESLSEQIKSLALMLAATQEQTSSRLLLSKIFSFLKERFFLGEEIYVTRTKSNYVACKVIEVVPPKERPDDGVYDPKTVKYKVQRLQHDKDTWITQQPQARRRRYGLNMEILKNFLKLHTDVMESTGAICVKRDSFEKYVANKNLKFETIYVGNMPKWEPGKKINKGGLKQLSIGNYVVPSSEDSQKEKLENLKEAMERLRREKEEQQAEMERKRIERMAKVEEELNTILRRCDDLERSDQKGMPVYKPVRTLVATKYFGDFLMLQEFLHSFSSILSASDVFRTKVTFQQMCRAFLIREVAGPLSDILQVLISTIFALQIEERNDCPVTYVKNKKEGSLWSAANEAIDTHMHVKSYMSLNMYELPIDSQTLTEILRLHLLSSGAPTDERAQTYRYQYRNGYSPTEDPGLLLRLEYPHILRAMKMYTIYQLPFKDILKVLNCLMEQILTYNATIICLEERQEALYKVRNNIKMLVARENKRIQNVINAKKALTVQFQADCVEHNENADKKAELERAMNRKLQEIEAQDMRERGNFEYELNRMNAEFFDYLILLGTDRAYRRYYAFESLPGLFVEHASEEVGPCLSEPPKNDAKLAAMVKERNKLRTFLLARHKQGDKENMKKTNQDKSVSGGLNTTPTIINGEVAKLNGSAVAVSSIPEIVEPTANELYMCSGDLKNCIIHDGKHPARTRWTYISSKDELDALIDSLHTLGIRESLLRETLIKMRTNLIPHLSKCPTDILDVDAADREKSVSQMLAETQKKYANSNFGFPENSDINEVMLTTLIRQILEFESEITHGNLGKMKIPNMDRWRQDLANNMYESQCKKLKYGPEISNGNNKDVEIKAFTDPGESLGNTYNIESEDSSDETTFLHKSAELQRNVRNIASALLQIEQSIEQKFLNEPFGVKAELKDRNEMESRLIAGKSKLLQWEVSLMNSTSYSQIFLHLNILSDAVKWNKSSARSSCLICRRKGDADKLLLCDDCNAGTHMFCMKPKMKKIPEGNWYCFRCEEKRGLKKETPKKMPKKVFSMEEDEDDEEEKVQSEQSEVSDIEVQTGKATTVSRKKPQKTTTRKTATGKRKAKNSRKSLTDNDVRKVLSESDDDDENDTEPSEDNTAAVSSDSDDTDDNKPLISNGVVKRQRGRQPKTKPAKVVDEEEMYIIDGDICKLCRTDETDLSCGSCKDCYHLECTGLRRLPRGIWQCSECKSQGMRKRKTDDSTNSDSDLSEEETENENYLNPPQAKRSRRSNNRNKGTEGISKNNNNSRRRRTAESSPLDMITLYDLLDQIMKHTDAWPFLRPVSPTEVPDYYQIIKNPMDFARIKSNLNIGRYAVNEEVLSDIQLVFRNCDTYNTEGNDVYRAGASLERFVIKKCKELNLKFIPSDMNAE